MEIVLSACAQNTLLGCLPTEMIAEIAAYGDFYHSILISPILLADVEAMIQTHETVNIIFRDIGSPKDSWWKCLTYSEHPHYDDGSMFACEDTSINILSGRIVSRGTPDKSRRRVNVPSGDECGRWIDIKSTLAILTKRLQDVGVTNPAMINKEVSRRFEATVKYLIPTQVILYGYLKTNIKLLGLPFPTTDHTGKCLTILRRALVQSPATI